MPDLIRGHATRGRGHYGEYTDDGSEGIDEEAIERDWVANCCPEDILQAAKQRVKDTDDETEGDDFECVELRNTILRFIEDVENSK